MTWIKNFVYDLINLENKELLDKYDGKIPEGTTVTSILSFVKNENLEKKFLDNEEKNKDGTFLIKEDNFYKFFIKEKGIRHWEKTHDNIHNALFDKIDSVLNDLSYTASDTKIN